MSSLRAPHTSEESRECEDLSKVPRIYAPRKRPVRRWIARFIMALAGWTIETPPPDLKKMVVVAAPHTYWWDGFWMKAFSWAFGMHLSWLVKVSTTRGFTGWFIRKTGGVPVDRSSPQGLVQQLVNEFRERDHLILVIPPEGTRARREFWKSGFYHIARQADVPVCLSYLDYGRTAVGCGPCIRMTGDVAADMDRIRKFYKPMRGKRHEKFTEPRLREEAELAAAERGATDSSDPSEPATSDEPVALHPGSASSALDRDGVQAPSTDPTSELSDG